MDIVQQLRQPTGHATDYVRDQVHDPLCLRAADEIERLRAALKPFAAKAAEFDHLQPPVPDEYPVGVRITLGDCRQACAALEQKASKP